MQVQFPGFPRIVTDPAACEGALLVVDASQGVEAQTVANCYTAIEQGVEVIPVLNKIDLPAADPERAIQNIEEVIGIDAQDAARISAKTGENIIEVLETLIVKIPQTKVDPSAPLKALIIDSWFDNYVGVVGLVVRVRTIEVFLGHRAEQGEQFGMRRRALGEHLGQGLNLGGCGERGVHGVPGRGPTGLVT